MCIRDRAGSQHPGSPGWPQHPRGLRSFRRLFPATSLSFRARAGEPSGYPVPSACPAWASLLRIRLQGLSAFQYSSVCHGCDTCLLVAEREVALREGEDRDERAAGAQEGGEFDSEPQVDLEPDHVVGLNLPGQPPAGPAPPLWTRDFIFLVAGNLALFMSFYLLLPTLPVYVVEMGGGETAAGLIVGLFSVSAVLIRPAVGWGLDVLGRRLLITVGPVSYTHLRAHETKANLVC